MQNEQIELLSLASSDDEAVLSFPLPDRIFGFHAQQAVEKLLKMLILANRQRHKFTHDIELLQDSAEALGEVLPQTPFPINQLTAFAVQVRYDTPRALTAAERDQIRETVRILREHVRARLIALNA
jgi:HEPN domain-containing protein